MRLLIIEDDKDVLAYIKKGMAEAGHNTDEATNGKDGLFMATTEDYDVMIVDRMLPELDGLTIVQTLRGSNNHTPALILSALGEVDDRVKGLKSGGDDYMVKPFSFAELLARVEILGRRRGNDSQETSIAAQDLELNLLSRQVTRQGPAIISKALALPWRCYLQFCVVVSRYLLGILLIISLKIHTFDDRRQLLIGLDITTVTNDFKFMQIVGGISILFIMMVVFVAYIISVFVVSNTNKIAKTAQDIIDTGDLSRRLDVTSRWELLIFIRPWHRKKISMCN